MHPKLRNAPNHEFRVQWGGSGAFIAKKSDATSWHELFHQFGPFWTEFQKSTKRSQMHQNCTNAPKHEFRVQWVDRVHSLRTISMQLRGTNFCTSSACFAPSFIGHPNGPKCTQIVPNAPKCQFRVQWGGSGSFVGKIPTRLRGTNFCTSLARFAPSFVRQPNGPECTQIVRNDPKCRLRVQWGASGAFVAKNSDATSWHVILH